MRRNVSTTASLAQGTADGWLVFRKKRRVAEAVTGRKLHPLPPGPEEMSGGRGDCRTNLPPPRTPGPLPPPFCPTRLTTRPSPGLS